jgi:hypothetical protein
MESCQAMQRRQQILMKLGNLSPMKEELWLVGWPKLAANWETAKSVTNEKDWPQET